MFDVFSLFHSFSIFPFCRRFVFRSADAQRKRVERHLAFGTWNASRKMQTRQSTWIEIEWCTLFTMTSSMELGRCDARRPNHSHSSIIFPINANGWVQLNVCLFLISIKLVRSLSTYIGLAFGRSKKKIANKKWKKKDKICYYFRLFLCDIEWTTRFVKCMHSIYIIPETRIEFSVFFSSVLSALRFALRYPISLRPFHALHSDAQ